MPEMENKLKHLLYRCTVLKCQEDSKSYYQMSSVICADDVTVNCLPMVYRGSKYSVEYVTIFHFTHSIDNVVNFSILNSTLKFLC